MDNVEEMDKFLEKYNFPKLDQEEMENLNRPITSTEMETVIRNLPTTKAQDQTASQLNSTKNLVKTQSEVAQSSPTLSDPMDCSLPGSSVHGDCPGKNTGVGCHALLQGLFPTRDQTQVSHIAGGFFTLSATGEA